MNVNTLFGCYWRNMGLAKGRGLIFRVLMVDEETIFASSESYSYRGTLSHFSCNFEKVAA